MDKHSYSLLIFFKQKSTEVVDDIKKFAFIPARDQQDFFDGIIKNLKVKK